MGAKQSKRSVDISGKEAESAGEVAASIAGGEGRVEPLADADALKPQLNGDAHIHDTEEKQKDIDSGTPENEKDATTEKETKQQDEEKESTPLTNGESEQKVENGETTPTPDDGKKPKKEKVKKKWSLRSISFSRKDKPKQEKKPKDEEPKTNGEPEKVPEETAEVAPEVPAVTETAEEVKTPSEAKEDKTPDTPVTEPITNGSSTPESPKIETPVVEEPAASSPEVERPEPKAEIEPEQLPVNGLSLEESTKEKVENEPNEDSKEESAAETTEIVPEISVKKEVCVEQMPLIDTTPPPLPANPPPSSVASFAATTMAPELTDASLANTADNAIPPPPPSDPIVKDKLHEIPSEPESNLTVTQTVSVELPSPVKEIEESSATITEKGIDDEAEDTVSCNAIPTEGTFATVDNVIHEKETIKKLDGNNVKTSESVESDMPSPPSELVEELVMEKEKSSESAESVMPTPPPEIIDEVVMEKDNGKSSDNSEAEMPAPPPELAEEAAFEKEQLPANGELELPPPPTQVVEPPEAKKKIDIEEISKISELEIPVPLEISLVAEVNEHESNSEKMSATASLFVCDVPDNDVIENNSVSAKNEAILETQDTLIKNNHISDTKPHSKEIELKNESEDLEQNLKKKSDSPENVIETIECNGNIEEKTVISPKRSVDILPTTLERESTETITAISEKKTTELISANAEKEPAKIISPVDIKEIGNIESGRTVTSLNDSTAAPAPVQVAGDSAEPPSPPAAPAHRDVEPDPTTPQEVIPGSDKLTDLIPEVPEVPELKTETLQETTSDVAVAN